MEQVIDFFRKLFWTEAWPPRWHCGEWAEFHGWLYIFSDLAIWGAYFIIPLFLLKLLSKKEGIPLPSVFWLFIAFILLCGLTHLVDAAIFWWPAYRLSALIRFCTGVVSWATVIVLVKILPQALKLKTSREFERELQHRKEVELKLTAAQELVVNHSKQLELKNKELEQFAYIASHDLQEPIRTVNSLMTLLKEESAQKLDSESAEYIDFALQATDRMKGLITGLLDYGRLGKDRELSLVNCNTLVGDVLKDLETKIKETHAKITVEPLPEISAYSTELRLLFQNLVSNALKFCKPDSIPEISISAQKQQNQWQFLVKDNGIGIDQRFKEKIFIIFQRLHTKTAYEGTGIGLAHCKKIIELHGGQIWVESTPGQGSSFFFSIPKQIVNDNYTQLHPAH